ncbi:MAG TPA: LysR family transcriptional regulator [Bordetella sp.]
MDLRRVDLNLLKIFESIYRLHNLSQVAEEVALTQPAISHALARLRDTVGDRLFVRTAAGLEPTSRADELIGPIKAALAMIEESLNASSEFDPRTCRREFQLLLSDVGELIFLPRLLQYLRKEAPGVKVSVRQASRTRYEAMLRDKDADLAVGNLPMMGKGLSRSHLFMDKWVVLRAKDAAHKPRLTVREFERCAHVLVDPPGTVDHPLTELLKQKNIARNVILTIPHFFALPSVILSSDLLSIVPYSVVVNLRSAAGMQVQALPFKAPALDICMYWHARRDADLAHAWFRGVFARLFSKK